MMRKIWALLPKLSLWKWHYIILTKRIKSKKIIIISSQNLKIFILKSLELNKINENLKIIL